MGIPIKKGRGRRRRSYADYRPLGRRQGPRNDPFRIIFYLLLIAGAIWVYFNQDTVRAQLLGEPAQTAAVSGSPRPSGVSPQQQAGQQLVEIIASAEQAYQQGRLLQAVDFYQQASELDPGNVQYYTEAARLLVFQSAMQYGQQRRDTLQQAVDFANSAITADPFNAAGYIILGKVYDWQDRPDQALSTILQGLEYDPDSAVGLSYYAEALVDLDRWDEATETIEKALTIAPDNVDVRRDYGYIMERLGDYAAAATQYEMALRLQPNLPYLHMALGRTYRELGRFTEAQDQFFAAQLIEPANALITFELARTYETYIGDLSTALDYYERTTEMDEGYAAAWVRIGTLHFFQENYSDAIIAFERALALEASSTDLYYQLGLSYANQGRCDSAVRYLQEAQTRAQGDQRILDAVALGYEICSQPTPVPVDVIGTPAVTPAP